MAYNERSLDDYIDVAQRIAEFRALYPDGSLQPADPAHPWEQATVTGFRKDGTEVTQTLIVYAAAAYRRPDDVRPGIGVAWELWPGRTPYTLGSELMNAETSAWGRAIVAALASDSKAGVASRQEVRARRAERDDGLPVNADGSLSRSRTTDEEKTAAGVLTAGQQAEHTGLRANRDASVPDSITPATAPDDPFYVRDPVEDKPGSSLPGQRTAVHQLLAKRGFASPDAQRQECSRLTGRDISSRTDLSYAEAGLILASKTEATP